MKKIYKTLLWCGLLLVTAAGIFSCSDFLDKEADAIVAEGEAFKTFTNFQGYIEEIYNCIPDKEKNYWTTSWNWGDDEVFNIEGNWHMTNQVDLGNFWAWQAGRLSQPGIWLDKPTTSPTSTNKFEHALWPHAWYSIRKVNLGLANIDKLIGTEEQKNLIAGQLYFFRAWWHFEMMEYFGGLPYVDQVFPADKAPMLPRLSYQECANKAGEDFARAAELLPIDWDKTTVGTKTAGKNQLRANKIMALGYLGKNYLWAASPLMKNGASLGGGNTYNYDDTFSRKAAEAFGQLLALVESGQTQYALVQFDYKNIYDHEEADGVTSKFSDIFYTMGQNWLMPGSTEAIFRGPSTDVNGSNWNTTKTFGPKVEGIVEHDNIIHQPTANYVKFYGMANGLPLNDPASGFDPAYPFKDRDPRFYHDIVFDGFKYVNASMPADMEYLRYAGLHSNGTMRGATNGSRTGYFIQKLVPHTANKYDGAYNWSGNLHIYLPYMRLADIYLMYAEACAAFDGAAGRATNFSKTAEDAINTIRDRAGAGHVHASYTGNREKFLDEVRRERAVELSFEGYRFNDLQRWLLLTEPPYNVKTSQEFDRLENVDFFKENDPKDARVANFREVPILTRQFGTRHYWFPLKVADVSMYPEFAQNPGW
ncbi:RagB/SusD family nutrient uptake outer membrane protein [Pseudochryseolinea flava]|uniref:RagB/SusD family nutrient uptake outer membrane protein n=1 Tax=Pseudochryseolinea flava TaxID=2059302 RepID=A0A364Y9I2_9BACT|nr:RagB/SusD family nutrient uptake outer membrane protein [Pseudochryseolinea flava]RAW02578.1 RagB/SusD family nutrient uptake outer membrane protein [Pseudochryseolinea flava]